MAIMGMVTTYQKNIIILENFAVSLLEMARRLPELLDQLDSGKIDAQEFSKLARSLIETPDSLAESSEKRDERMWAFFKGILDEWIDVMYEATTEYVGSLNEAAKIQFTEALKVLRSGKRTDTEMKIDKILEILTEKEKGG